MLLLLYYFVYVFATYSHFLPLVYVQSVHTSWTVSIHSCKGPSPKSSWLSWNNSFSSKCSSSDLFMAPLSTFPAASDCNTLWVLFFLFNFFSCMWMGLSKGRFSIPRFTVLGSLLCCSSSSLMPLISHFKNQDVFCCLLVFWSSRSDLNERGVFLACPSYCILVGLY